MMTVSNSNNFAPAWSPDGQYIYYGSDRSGAWNIYRLDLETGLQTAIEGARGRAPQISPDSTWLYYSRIDENGLWRRPLNSEGGEEKVLENLAPVDWNNWQVTDNAIYFIRRRIPNQPELVRLDLTSGQDEILAAIPDLLHNSGLWVAPDSSYALLTRMEDVNADLVLLGNGD